MTLTNTCNTIFKKLLPDTGRLAASGKAARVGFADTALEQRQLTFVGSARRVVTVRRLTLRRKWRGARSGSELWEQQKDGESGEAHFGRVARGRVWNAIWTGSPRSRRVCGLRCGRMGDTKAPQKGAVFCLQQMFMFDEVSATAWGVNGHLETRRVLRLAMAAQMQRVSTIMMIVGSCLTISIIQVYGTSYADAYCTDSETMSLPRALSSSYGHFCDWT
jgi:hypothetical protein